MRLIDANKLVKLLEKQCLVSSDEYENGHNWGIDKAITIVTSMTTIDDNKNEYHGYAVLFNNGSYLSSVHWNNGFALNGLVTKSEIFDTISDAQYWGKEYLKWQKAKDAGIKTFRIMEVEMRIKDIG